MQAAAVPSFMAGAGEREKTMTFAPFVAAARVAALIIAMLITGAPAPARADGNAPEMFIGRDETILLPIPECPRCLAVYRGRCPAHSAFAPGGVCPD